MADDDWHRIERDLEEIVPRLTPGVTLTNIDYVQFGVVSSYPCWVDDIRLSNSITVEKNVLAGGSIGHIIRNRTINPSTYAATDSWFHYDQVGSVMSVSNNSGNLQTRIDQDAFGNVLANWQSGQWASDSASAGWHHNTKELDGDIGLVYMFQRWYLPEVGVFASVSPLGPDKESRYSFVESSPVSFVDPKGRERDFIEETIKGTGMYNDTITILSLCTGGAGAGNVAGRKALEATQKHQATKLGYGAGKGARYARPLAGPAARMGARGALGGFWVPILVDVGAAACGAGYNRAFDPAPTTTVPYSCERHCRGICGTDTLCLANCIEGCNGFPGLPR